MTKHLYLYILNYGQVPEFCIHEDSDSSMIIQQMFQLAGCKKSYDHVIAGTEKSENNMRATTYEL